MPLELTLFVIGVGAGFVNGVVYMACALEYYAQRTKSE